MYLTQILGYTDRGIFFLYFPVLLTFRNYHCQRGYVIGSIRPSCLFVGRNTSQSYGRVLMKFLGNVDNWWVNRSAVWMLKYFIIG